MARRTNKKRTRISFAKRPETLEILKIPDLLSIQKESFSRFLKEGLIEVLSEFSPIEDNYRKIAIEFGPSHFGEIKYSVEDCKERDMNYSSPLSITVRLIHKDTGEIKEQSVFVGDFPMMTEKSSFIINGTERVVVSQLVRSPGVYFKEEEVERGVYSAKIVPNHGAWLEFELDGRDILTVRIDRRRKLLATIFLKAIGVGLDEELAQKFDNSNCILATLKLERGIDSKDAALVEVYKKLRPGEPHTAERAEQYIKMLFFDFRHYNLAKVGRYKINKKLELNIPLEKTVLTPDDIMATVKYLIKLREGKGSVDDIDHFGNRRVRSCGELIQEEVRIGLARVERMIRGRMSTIQNIDTVTPQYLVNMRPLTAVIREFFGTSQLSQFMDQTNPLAGLTHKRRLSALGPGGLTRERAGVEVRDVHPSHYGRMCPIETPEGPNIGLIGSLATYSRVNKFGFIESPYRVVKKGKVTDKLEYLSADEEEKYIIAQASAKLDKNGRVMGDRILARAYSKIEEVNPKDVSYMDVSPRQIFSVSTNLIPFLEHDDANRALMGSNMQRQAVPLIRAEAPLIGTGMEFSAAKDSGEIILAKTKGVVKNVCADYIDIETNQGAEKYNIFKFRRSNQGTCVSQRPIVEVGNSVKAGDILADSLATDFGELALGRNLLVAFMPWEGYNYEDAIVISERVLKEDILTSIHIEEYEIDARDTKQGKEEITRDIPNASEEMLKDLDERGIIRIGAEVNSGDILVGKITPKGQTELTGEEKLLREIFREKAGEVRDTSLRVPHGEGGVIINAKLFTREDGDILPSRVNQLVRVYVAQKRKICDGDKLAGRHGNKGVISKILPEEDMPFLPDGTHIDIILNPHGVPSRINIGQIFESHLGWAAHKGWDSEKGPIHIISPAFFGATEKEIKEMLKKAKLPKSGKTILYDGRTGEPFDREITVGYIYIMKLNHLVDDKIHARSTGSYSLITQQPLGGKAQFGGQRFGEMEVWALEAYGAAYALQELLTVKSDDIAGRAKTYEAIVKGENIPTAGIPESFKVLTKEMEGLAINVEPFKIKKKGELEEEEKVSAEKMEKTSKKEII